MWKVTPSQVTWNVESRSITIHGLNGKPWARIHLPLADDRAIITAGYALNFATKEPENARRNAAHHPRRTDGATTPDSEDGRRGRKGASHDARRPDLSRPNVVESVSARRDNVARQAGAKSKLSDDSGRLPVQSHGGHGGGEAI